MRQREVVEFRTPQHPSLGTNHWGGASPLLARNIPKESLELRYLRLNTVRSRDEIFPAQEHDFNYLHDDADHVSKHDYTPKPSRRIKGFLTKLKFFPRKENVELGWIIQRKRDGFPGGILQIGGLKVGADSILCMHAEELAAKNR